MPGWFKDMEVIIWEHGLWPEGGGGYMHSAWTSIVCLIKLTAAASAFYLIRPILLLKIQKPKLQGFIKSHGHFATFI